METMEEFVRKRIGTSGIIPSEAYKLWLQEALLLFRCQGVPDEEVLRL